MRYTLDLCVATVNAKSADWKKRGRSRLTIDNPAPRMPASPHYLLIVRRVHRRFRPSARSSSTLGVSDQQEGHMARAIALACGILLVVCVSSAAGQTYQGGVRGQVRDPQGVIPGAEVILVDQQTNATRTAVTNDVGEYAFANVLPATYTLKVSITGFKAEERKGLRVGTQQFIVEDFTLQVGAVEEQITVTGESPLIESSNPAVAASLDSEDARKPADLRAQRLLPGDLHPERDPDGRPAVRPLSGPDECVVSVAGRGPRRGNGYLLEGVPITDFTNRPTIVPSIEAIEDLKVQVKTYDADMGHAAGGVFNTTAKSGSNTWHGSAVFVTKPERVTGKLYFPTKTGAAKPPQYYYDWGGSLGGPIVKDKTFFWFTTEGYQQKSTRSAQLTLPTALERAGNFSQTVNAAGSRVVIYDPLTTRTDPATGALVRDPFPGNVIPANRINPVAAAMIKTMPLPTSGKTFNGNAVLVDGPQDQQTIKMDHRWNDKLTTTGDVRAPAHARAGLRLFRRVSDCSRRPGQQSAPAHDQFRLGQQHLAAEQHDGRGDPLAATTASSTTAPITPSSTQSSLGLPTSYVNALAFNTFPAIVVSRLRRRHDDGQQRAERRHPRVAGREHRRSRRSPDITR